MGDQAPAAASKQASAAASKKKRARIKSALKRARQTPKRTAVNTALVSRMRTSVRAVEAAIAAGNKALAQKAMRLAEPLLARAGAKGVVHHRAAARKISRLVARLRKIG